MNIEATGYWCNEHVRQDCLVCPSFDADTNHTGWTFCHLHPFENTLTLDLARIAQIRADSGFTAPSPENLDTKLLLVVSEITEVQNEIRDGHLVTDLYTSAQIGWWCVEHHDSACTLCKAWIPSRDPLKKDIDINPQTWERFELAKPEGVGIELIDAILRLCDIGYANGIDLQDCYERKMTFNAARPHKHGRVF